MDIVYIIKNPSFKYYKIGHTKNFEKRIGQLNTSVPNDYELICTFEHETKETLETKLHNFFEEKNHNREFFELEHADFLDVFRIADQEGYKCTYEDIVAELTHMLVEKKIAQLFAELIGNFSEDPDVRRLIKMAYPVSWKNPLRDGENDFLPSELSKIERDKINILIDEIREISDEYGGSAPKNVLYDHMTAKYSIPEKKLDEIISMLNSRGICYSPFADHYKVA